MTPHPLASTSPLHLVEGAVRRMQGDAGLWLRLRAAAAAEGRMSDEELDALGERVLQVALAAEPQLAQSVTLRPWILHAVWEAARDDARDTAPDGFAAVLRALRGTVDPGLAPGLE